MRKLNIFTVFFAVLTILVPLLIPPASALDIPDIPADAGLLIEAGTGLVLYEKNANDKIAPGGIVKVMTLLTALGAVEDDKVGMDDIVTVSASALNSSPGGVLHIAEGETIPLRDLLYFAFLASDADACSILAEYIAGAPDAFVSLMNSEAKRLGCTGTHFTNTDGMPDPEQYTTAWDQYLIMKEAVKHILFLDIAGALSYKSAASSGAPGRVIDNGNLMLYGSSAFFSKYCIAGKTGEMAEEKSSFVSCAKNSSMTLICVVFGAESAPAGEEPAAEQSYYETKRLFEWGFANFAWSTVLNQADIIVQEDVTFAQEADNVEIRPQESVTVLTRADMTNADIRKEIILFSQTEGKTLTAPVKEGVVLGEIRIYIDGVLRGKTKLVAARDVGLNRSEFMKYRINQTLHNTWVQVGAAVFLLLLAGYIYLIIRARKARKEKKRQIEEIKRKLIEERHRSYK